jgi:nicotinamide mononucleotide transporter
MYWPMGLIGIFFYFIIFQNTRDWINMSIQVVFAVQSLVGWFRWSTVSNEKISYLSNRWTLLIVFPMWGALYFISNYFNGSNSTLDSLTSSLSLLGSYLMIYRKVESWIFWILCDVFMIFLFIENKLWLSSAVYFIFLIICVFGFFKWRKDIEVH